MIEKSNVDCEVAPEGWQEVTVEDIKSHHSNAISTGPFGSSIGSRFFQESGIPVIRGSNLSQDISIHLKDDELVFLSPEKAREFTRSTVRQGDLIFTCWGTINQIGLIDDSSQYDEYVISNKQMKLTPDPRKANSFFLYSLFSGSEIQRIIQHQNIGSSVPGFNLGQLREIRFNIPPLAEQNLIASALSDTDALIESLEQLLAKKRQIKQGAMQELLTGRKRIEGFEEGYQQTELGAIPKDWNFVDLNSVSSEAMQNGVFYTPSRKGRGVKLINVGDLYNQTPIDSETLELFDASNSEKERFKVESGDLFFTRSSVVPSGIAYCNVYLSSFHKDIVFDSHVIRVRPDRKKVDPSYLFRFCISQVARKYLIAHAKTGSMTTIDQGVLGRCPVFLPTIEEQTAIATILSDMDLEIEAIEAKLSKARQLKQGMMHELLTGRIRLVEP